MEACRDMKKIYASIVLILFISLVTACSNHVATTKVTKTVISSGLLLLNYNKNELVRDADVIIRGTVIAQKIKKDSDNFPATDTTIVVKEIYKGAPEKEVIVRTKGGQIDDTLYVFEDNVIPQFKERDDVVVFLTNQTGNRPDKDQFDYYVVGQIQGKFDVVNNEHLEGFKVKQYGFQLKDLQEQIKEITIENEQKPPE